MQSVVHSCKPAASVKSVLRACSPPCTHAESQCVHAIPFARGQSFVDACRAACPPYNRICTRVDRLARVQSRVRSYHSVCAHVPKDTR
jgi:hypothetical protein